MITLTLASFHIAVVENHAREPVFNNTRILAHLDMQVLLTVYTLGIITAFKLMNTMNGFSSSESTVPLLIKMSSLLWFVYVDVYQWKNKRLQRMSGRPNRRREQSPNINKYK